MNVTTLSLHHLLRPPISDVPEPPLLLLLHGIGSNEHDLFALATYLDQRFLILSARAPITLMPGSYAWFHADLTAGTPHINPVEAESSRRAILEFIDEAVDAYTADRNRVYLMGFSQGAIMSMSVMLTRPEALAGVIAMSGRILPEVRPLTVAHEKLTGFPVMVVHGVYDEVLTISYGRASREYLSTLPVNLTYREYPMGHQISEESLGDARAWLSQRLDVKVGKTDV
jgi:phospholipase/carboxylesterase